VNYRAISSLTPQRIDEMADLIRGEVPLEHWPAEWFPHRGQHPPPRRLLDHGLAPGAALAAAFARGAAALLDEVKTSGLRGRGGAGFLDGAEMADPAAMPRATVANITWCATPTKANPVPSRTACC
jgi:hypothetical protein